MRWWPLLAVAAVGAGLRWFRIDAQSLWYDEGISAHQLMRSFADIARASALDTHPPLYYWTLKAWSLVVPASELGLRSLSAVWGVVGVVLTGLIARRLFGPLVGFIAALLIAVAPLAVYYSQEVRMYTQVTALGLAAAFAYLHRRWLAYALAGLATLYSQYLGVALLAAINLHALFAWRGMARRDRLGWLAGNAGIVLGFLPWLPAFIGQQNRALNTSPRTPAGLAIDTLAAYGGGLVKLDLTQALGVGLVVCALMAAIAAVPAVRRLVPLAPGMATRSDPEFGQAVLLVMLLWLVPLGLVLFLGLRSGLFELRYVLLGVPGLAIAAAVGLVWAARRPTIAIVAALVACVPGGVALERQYVDPALTRDNYRDLVAAIARDAQPGDAVVLSAPNQTEVFGYYYHGDLPLIGMPRERPLDVADTTAQLEDIGQRYDRVWLVGWAMDQADPGGVISRWLADNGFQSRHDWYGSVQLSLIGFGHGQATTTRVNAAFDDGVKLDAYRLSSRRVRRGETIALTLVWRASHGPTPRPWKVFTHLLDSSQRVVAQRDAEPADNLRPTTSWARGEQVEDRYGLSVPADLPAGTYTLEVGMYSGEQRSQIEGRGDHLELGSVDVVAH